MKKPCECTIEPNNLEEETEIVYCPLHAAAWEMYKELISVVRDCQRELDEGGRIPILNFERLQALLNKAEGQP